MLIVPLDALTVQDAANVTSGTSKTLTEHVLVGMLTVITQAYRLIINIHINRLKIVMNASSMCSLRDDKHCF